MKPLYHNRRISYRRQCRVVKQKSELPRRFSAEGATWIISSGV